jgi:hypothetical protein
MGRWGTGLYDDDKAADLRQTIALIATIPASGDRLLEIVLMHEERPPELTDGDGCTFWLVIADQFERRGIRCDTVVERALMAIDAERDQRERATSYLGRLAKRLRSPRPERRRPRKPRPPAAVVTTGEIYAFPTMAGLPVATHVTSAADFDRRDFVPDGWGVIVIVDQGRAFEWIPWCAVASVSVDPSETPTLPGLLGGELLYHSQTNGATRCIPKPSELAEVSFQRVGTVTLDPSAARALVARWPSETEAVQLGWRMRYAAFGRNTRFTLPTGPRLSTLVAQPLGICFNPGSRPR